MIKCYWFGRLSYENGLKIQDYIVNKLKNLPPSSGLQYVCLFEHHPVYTVGLREHVYSANEESRLRKTGADFYRVKRGGLITFHGPGQLVAYPVFNLRTLPKAAGNNGLFSSVGVRSFVNSVEETVIDLLSNHFKIGNVGRTTDTGVWIDGNQKIAAIGIQVRSGITSHGVALNCNTDLKWFEHIVPCGLEGKMSTSVSKELAVDVPVTAVLHPFCDSLQSIFQLPVELKKNLKLSGESVDDFLRLVL